MDTENETNEQPSSSDPIEAKYGCRKVAMIAGASALVAGIAVFAYFKFTQAEAEKAQKVAAQEMFAPVSAQLDEGVKQTKTYDIDKTIRVIHSVDAALDQQKSLRDYLRYMAAEDYRGVAPEVLESRKKVLDVLQRVYETQTSLENQEATFTVTRTILSAVTLVDADVSLASGVPAVDREQAKSILADLRRGQEERKELLNDLGRLENELISVMVDYSETYYKYVDEWDKVSTVRDRAYLDASAGDWASAMTHADRATEMAPDDTEAHLLAALARVQLAGTTPDERALLDEGRSRVQKYMEKHPGRTAPAFLILGLAASKSGDRDGAIRHFEQAAAYYPKQADALDDMLDPYTVRSFLRKSKEGRRIVDLYKSTMLGAGFFSPDLQLAKIHFEAGETDAGRQKVLDHFSRRRGQEQWDLILQDVTFCSEFLGASFDSILVEDSHLELKVDPNMIGSSIDVSIKNGSAKPLHNATLLMALRFTDMHRDDFEVFKVGETVPVVTPKAETDFGTLEIDFDFLGTSKGKDDIVVNRAVLVTDNAVVWVDTDAYRLALARDVQARAAKDDGLKQRQKDWFDAMKISPDLLRKRIEEETDMKMDMSLGKDDVSVDLPKELALLNPVFRLKVGDKMNAPTINQLGTDGINLSFDNVENFDAKDAAKNVSLVVSTQYGDFEVGFNRKSKKFEIKNAVFKGL